MKQADLIAAVAKKTGLTARDAKGAVQTIFGTIQSGLAKGDSVRTTLGTFSVSRRGARQGRNPRTGEPIKIKATKTVRFKASKPVKDKINKR
jgi:DNA-binding protein HU-beta